MRLRAGLVLCLFSILWCVGCRKSLTPAYDANQAPETWITAAPQDTITTRDALGRPVAPSPGKIPVRFHVYWAGSDKDGAVIGFYYAVVETLPISPLGGVPDLPGPKPRDYHYTTRTDSTFVFTVSEQAPDRQHAFFIYSVDNQGKPDATPARFIFNAEDRFPPAIYVDLAQAEGDIWKKLGGSLVQDHRVFTVTDTFNPSFLVKDTVPANAVLHFAWHGEPTLPGTYVTGFRFRLDETSFNVVDSSYHSVQYNTGVVDHIAPGPKLFTVRAVDQAGGARQTTRRFQMNMSPTTWFSGPDPAAYPYTHSGNDTYADVPSWFSPPHFLGSLLSADSITVMPALRPERRTFFEIYKNRLYVRSEFDTVNMNSWVVLMSGGLDPDSPYSIRISPADPGLPDTSGLTPGAAVVLHQSPPNGSPVGFRSLVIGKLTPFGAVSTPSQTFLYPLFDPTDVRRLPIVNGYWGMFQAGKAFAIARAEDGNGKDVGGLDNSVGDPRVLAEKVDAGMGTPQENDLRSRVLTFYVNKAPGLRFGTTYVAPGFKPNPIPPYTVYPSRTIDINLPAEDLDPYDQDNRPARVGGPSATTVLQWFVSFRGKNADGRDTTFAPDFLNPMSTQQSLGIVLPSYIASTTVNIDIRLCDCKNCQPASPTAVPGAGRCADYSFPFTVPPPPPAPADAASSSSVDRPRPGSSQDASRSDAP